VRRASARIRRWADTGFAFTGFTAFAKENPRPACNTLRTNGAAVLYRSAEGYTGKDGVTVEVTYADGRESSTRFAIEVK
jgi:hypothetical protein